MKHLGTKTIETDRLVLRRFEVSDAEAMYRNWANDREVTKYLTWPVHADPEVTGALLETWVKEYENDHYYQWAIGLKERNGEPIGSISVVHSRDDIEMVHIGYCIGRAWWNQGIMTEALSAVIDFFFDEVEVNRVECRHDPNNPNSGKVMQKCGMKYEGTMRSADRNNQGICDASLYGLLRSDREKDS